MPTPPRGAFWPAPPQRDEGEIWYLSLADLMSLLLTFFILLAAVSSVSMNDYKEIAASMAKTMGGAQAARPAGPPEVDMAELNRQIQTLVATPELSANVDIRRRDRGLVVDIRGGILFPLGSAELTPNAEEILTALAGRLGAVDVALTVEGHTDNLPIASERFPSNWELSAARAASVARFVISRGVPAGRVVISGFADTQPLASNDSAENQARNRRVSLVITPRPRR